MRYGYDLKNPMDREMYLKMRQREFERVNNKDLTLSQAYTEYLKDNKKEMEYFLWRDRQEQELKKEREKQIKKHEGIASYEIVSEEISEDGQTAKVKAEITYGDGKKDDSKFDFKLVDGEWKQEISK